MVRHVSAQQDVLSNILAAHEIYAGNIVEKEKTTIERVEVQLGQRSGVGLRLSRVHALSTVRRRRPLYLLPTRPALMVNHSAELETLHQALSNFKIVDLHGPDGLGKSTLVAALVQTFDLNHFADGAVYVTGRIRHQDLLQALFESFYESDNPVKITPQHAPSYLYNLRALVVLDDVGLGPKQIDPILDALGNAAVLIVGPERTALGRGQALALRGLPRQEAVSLFEMALGWTPSPNERAAIEQICARLNDAPLATWCVAAQAAQSAISLTKLSADLNARKSWAGPGGDLSVGPSLEQIILDLDAADRRLLTLTAAFAGPSVPLQALRALMDPPVTGFNRRIERLRELGLLHTLEFRSPQDASLRLALSPAYGRAVQTWLVDDTTRLEIVKYFVTQLESGDRLPGIELPSLLGAIEDCARNGWLEALTTLVYAADRSLARLGWWAEWEHVLDLTRRAAQADQNRVLEAWAMHQLGSLLGALGVFERAFHMLETAYNIRHALEDEVGATLTAHNLKVLDRLLPPPVEKTTASSVTEAPRAETGALSLVPQTKTAALRESTDEPSSATPSRIGKILRRIGLTAVAILAVLLIGALGLRFVRQEGNGEDVGETPGLTISWEFGEAWNSLDNTTWTQQVIIVAEDGKGDYRYFADGEPVSEMFEVVLPLCDGARGTIRVEAEDGRTAQITYEFASPFCP